jgi:hypothetical protein
MRSVIGDSDVAKSKGEGTDEISELAFLSNFFFIRESFWSREKQAMEFAFPQ